MNTQIHYYQAITRKRTRGMKRDIVDFERTLEYNCSEW